MLRLSLAPVLLVAAAATTPAPSPRPTTIDEGAYGACRQSNCPCERGFEYPADWGSDATVDINYVRTNAFIAAAVNCVCARCGHYDIIKTWPAYAAGVCDIAQTVVADGSAASQVVLSYYPLDDSTCAATRTLARALPDGVCVDPQIAGLAGVKFTCSADGATYDYEIYPQGAFDSNCQGAADAGGAFATPTSGCYLSADPAAPGEWYISAECFGPDYNSDTSCGAPASTVDAGKNPSSGQTTSSSSRALVTVVVAVAVAAFAGACCAAAVTVLRLRASSAEPIQEAGTRIHPAARP